MFLSGLLTASVAKTQRPSLVMMKSHDAMTRPLTVLIPLYVYPLPEAWEPLFQMYGRQESLFRPRQVRGLLGVL